MRKRGQFQISFGMIFSIIIIIAIIAISVYVIGIFLDFNKCGKTVLFYEELEEEINTAWESPTYRKEVNFKLSGDVEKICVGDPTLARGGDLDIRDEIANSPNVDYKLDENRIFVYPPEESCGGRILSSTKSKIFSESFSCVTVKNGEIKLQLTKSDLSDDRVVIDIIG